MKKEHCFLYFYKNNSLNVHLIIRMGLKQNPEQGRLDRFHFFLFVQGDSGGPMMCELDGSWFQAVVLSPENNSTRQTRADPVMVFTKLSRFQAFLNQTLGTFLSPASTSTTAAATTTAKSRGAFTHSSSSTLFAVNLLVLSACLYLFS